MLEKRLFTGGVDKDTESRLLQPGDYRDALNVQAGVSSEDSSGSIEKVKGNTLLTGYNYQQYAGDVCIGGVEDEVSKALYFFICNTGSPNQHRVVKCDYSQYSTLNQLSVIASGAGLNFNENYLITGANVINRDHLYWTDDFNEPSKIYLPEVENDFYLNRTDRTYFDAIPYAPLFPPYAEYKNSSTDINTLNGYLYQFKHRIVYKDGTKSSFSPISKVCLPMKPDQNLSDGINAYISVEFDNAYDNVEWNEFAVSIEIAARNTNQNDFQIIHERDVEVGVGLVYKFDNTDASKVLPLVESNALYNFTPLKAKSQEVIDSNRLAYGNIVEGYDNIEFNIDPQLKVRYTGELAGDPVLSDVYGLPTFGVSVTKEAFGEVVWQRLSVTGDSYHGIERLNLDVEVLATGEKVNFYFDFTGAPKPNSQIIFEIAAEVNSKITNACEIGNQSVLFRDPSDPTNIVAKVIDFDFTTSEMPEILGTPLKTWKRGTRHTFGVVYYDKAGRSGLVQEWGNNSIYVQNISNNYPIGRTEISLDLYNQPPEWAYTYQVVYRGNNRYFNDLAEGRGFTQYLSSSYNFQTREGDLGVLQFSEVLNLSKNEEESVFSYGFKKGDRIKFIGYYSQSNTQRTFTPYLQIYDLKITKYDSGAGLIYFDNKALPGNFASSTDVLFEIYSPAIAEGNFEIGSTENELYYEIGEVRNVINPTQPFRTHQSDVNPQQVFLQEPATVVLNSGDVYLKNRVFKNYDFPQDDKWQTGLVANSIDDAYFTRTLRFLNVEESHYYDYKDSNDTDRGRVNIADPDFIQVRRDATIRYSDVYIPYTSINGLGTFFDLSFNDYEIEHGSVQKLYSEDKRLIVFQELKVGQAMVNESILRDNTGDILVQKSEQVLSDIQYYAGEFGISDVPESFAVYGFSKYFVDKNRGAILRLSNNGITKISDYKMHSYFNDLLRATRDSKERTRVLGVYNEINSEYIVSIDETVSRDQFQFDLFGSTVYVDQDIARFDAVTWSFNESSNRWTSRLSFTPEMMLTYGTDYVTFVDGACWRHNSDQADRFANFYDTQFDSTIDVIFNQNPSNIKFYKALELESNRLWEAIKIINQFGQESELLESDFRNIEGVWWAAFLRDKNTPNVALPLIEGDEMRGHELLVTFRNSDNSLVKLFSAGCKFEHSELTNR